ncbi:hypothetical protein KBD75_03905 [Candidatus Woesebacteria bacterium]|nr:hypothetical protein [Candidatus Woesebacteria bacterium]
MAKTKLVSHKRFYTILLVSLLLSFTYIGFKYLYHPKTSQIFEIAPASIQYGDTTLVGRLVKDTPVNENGSYLLVLPDMRLVYLTVERIDSLVGQNVKVTGSLNPSDDPSMPMIMVVTKIEVL